MGCVIVFPSYLIDRSMAGPPSYTNRISSPERVGKGGRSPLAKRLSRVGIDVTHHCREVSGKTRTLIPKFLLLPQSFANIRLCSLALGYQRLVIGLLAHEDVTVCDLRANASSQILDRNVIPDNASLLETLLAHFILCFRLCFNGLLFFVRREIVFVHRLLQLSKAKK